MIIFAHQFLFYFILLYFILFINLMKFRFSSCEQTNDNCEVDNQLAL